MKRCIKLLGGGGGVKSVGLVLNGVVLQYGMIFDSIVLEDFLLHILIYFLCISEGYYIIG